MLVASFASFFAGQAMLSGEGMEARLSDPDALRSVVGAALYLTVAGMTGVALGALLRNTAAAITTFVGVFFVIPPLTMLLPAAWSDTLRAVPALERRRHDVGGTYGVANPLAPWTGFGVMCAYAVALVGLAAWRLRRRDA